MRSSLRLATFLFVFLASFGLQVAQAATLEDEVLAYEAKDRTSPPPTGSVVVTGSSSIRLWTTMTTDLAPLGVIPRGFGGSTADDLDYYLERLVLVYQPRAVAIYEGDNDIAAGRTPQQIADRMTTILSRISARLPNARVYVISIKPSPARWASWSLAVDTNARLAALCATDARYTYINVVPALLGSNGQPRPELYQSDQLHLNATGYAIWTSVVKPVLHAVTDNLLLEIQKTFDFFKATAASDRIDRIVLSGGASVVDGFAQSIAERFTIPVEPFDPFRQVAMDGIALDDVAALTATAGVAVGLALRKAGDK